MSSAAQNTEVTAGDRELMIARTFDAPRNLVFEAWTRAEHLSRWFCPNNFRVSSCQMDFRVGGKYRLCMSGFDREHWVSGEYREIVAPERIVFVGSLDDGNEVVTAVTFTDLGSKTRLVVHQTFSIETDSTRGARQGWTETLEHLAEFLKAA